MMEFMDGLRRGVDRAGFEIDRLLRANRTRSRITALRSQIDGDLHEIGRYVMELYERSEDVPAGIRERCEKVKQLQEELASREAELEAIDSEVPHELEEVPLQEQPAPSADACPRCGRPVPEGASFCPSCGASLTSPAEAAPSPPEPPTQQTEPPPPAG